MTRSQKSVLAVLLVLLVLSGAAFAAGEEPPPAATAAPADAATRLIRVYYFRTTNRCVSCRKIESFTDEAIRSGFAQELTDGKLAWQVVNIQEAGNEHFAKDYQLATKSVVVVDEVGGKQVRWKNLAKIWELLNDQPTFARYVQDEVRQYLEKRS
jgi:hypothetical protein